MKYFGSVADLDPTYQPTGSGKKPRSGTLISKTSIKIIRKSYLQFLSEDLFLLKKCNISYDLRVKILYQLLEGKKLYFFFLFFNIGSDSRRIRIQIVILKTGSGSKLSGSQHCFRQFFYTYTQKYI